MSRPLPLAELQAKCDRFNAAVPVGGKVVVRRDNGDYVHTTLRYKAEVLSGHTAVAWFDGIAGCYDLDRASPAGDAS